MRCMQIGKRKHVAVARLAAQVLRVSLDAVEQSGCEFCVDFGFGRTKIFGEDRGGSAVAHAQVFDGRAIARTFGMMIDDDVRLFEAFWRVVAEHVRLNVDEYQRVELVKLFGRDYAHFDANRIA